MVDLFTAFYAILNYTSKKTETYTISLLNNYLCLDILNCQLYCWWYSSTKIKCLDHISDDKNYIFKLWNIYSSLIQSFPHQVYKFFLETFTYTRMNWILNNRLRFGSSNKKFNNINFELIRPNAELITYETASKEHISKRWKMNIFQFIINNLQH